MKKTYLLALAALSVLLVLSAASAAPLAPDYTKVGVKVGDTAIYRSSFTFSGVNKTSVLVYGIVGTQVTLNFTDYDPSGLVNSQYQRVGDIYNGVGWLFAYFLVAANLTAGDPLFSGAAETVENTVTMTIAGAARTVNHMRDPGGTVDVYWDQATGLMVELHLAIMGWENYTLISTNAWSPPAPPSLFSMTTVAVIEGITIIVLLVALVVVARGGGKSRGRK